MRPLLLPALLLFVGAATAHGQRYNFRPPSHLPAGARPAKAEDAAYVAWSKEHPATGPRQAERLGRGVVALRYAEDRVWVAWRLSGTEGEEVAFNLYRRTDGGDPVRLNETPLAQATFFVDGTADFSRRNDYWVRPVRGGVEDAAGESGVFLNTVPPQAPVRPYVEIPLQTREGYAPFDSAVGDLDGDGEYELIVLQCQRPLDNGLEGATGEALLEAYAFDGALRWRINLGRNVREGAAYLPFLVYDFDGDGRAELMCRTAPGTVDGTGANVLLAGDDAAADYRNATGRVLSGPEYLTVFDGRTGRALATVPYVPGREPLNGWGGVGGNGGNDEIGVRADRFLAGVAYLDGERPSAVFCRGGYGRTVLAAWDWRGGKLTPRWVFDSKDGASPYSGQGGHQLSVADADGDGRDEIICHSMVVDDNGKALFSTGMRHGDALHVGDLDVGRPGLEVFGAHENEGAAVIRYGTPGVAMYDAKTGQVLWAYSPGLDVSRALAADIDARHPGAETWWTDSAGLYTAQGRRIGPSPGPANFVLYWDGDPQRELLHDIWIAKWDGEAQQTVRLLTAEGCLSNNGAKRFPLLTGDVLGDWREEALWRTADGRALRLYTTTMPTPRRLFTLMHDPTYRLALAGQNAGYNQPPHLGFALGETPPSRPNITLEPPASALPALAAVESPQEHP